jgi:uncharacterized protein
MKVILLIIAFGVIHSSCKTECEKVIESFDNGQIRTLNIYPDCADTLSYTKREYYQTGQLATESFHNKNLDYIEYKSWFENGQQSALWMTKDEKEHGHILCWHQNGKLKKEGFLNEGLETGTHKEWHENGQLQQLGKMVNDLPDSIWTFWDKDGKLKTMETWDNGILSGQTKVFFPDGDIEVEVSYRNGKKDGEYKQWDKNGVLIRHYFIEMDSTKKVIVDD